MLGWLGIFFQALNNTVGQMGHLRSWNYNVYTTFSIALVDWEIEQITDQPAVPLIYCRVGNKL